MGIGCSWSSILLILLAYSLFGITSDISMQAVAVGFIIGVIQDPAETALNSSEDALFQRQNIMIGLKKVNL